MKLGSRFAIAVVLLTLPTAVAPVAVQAGPLQFLLDFFQEQLGLSYPAQSDRVPASHEDRRGRASLEHGELVAERLAQLAPLQFVAAEEVESKWQRAKAVAPLGKQLDHVDAKALRQLAAFDLHPVTDLRAAFEQTYRRRDGWRDRVFAKPELVAVLGAAASRLQAELPGTQITIGDVAQPVGGQIEYGTKIQLLSDGPLHSHVGDLLAAADWRGNGWVHAEIVDPVQAFEREWSRFRSLKGHVLLERTITAADLARAQFSFAPTGPEALLQGPAVRLETRRFFDPTALSVSEMAERWAAWAKGWAKAELASDVATRWGEKPARRVRLLKGQEVLELWLSGRDPLAVGKKNRVVWPELSRLLLARAAKLDRKKPSVFLAETRWMRGGKKSDPAWQRWRLLPEATHISHMGGLDADISYITHKHDQHFSKDISVIDITASLTWIRIITEAAQDAGVKVDKILVDPKVLSRLKAGVPDGEPLPPFWPLLASSPGHDSHLHLRLQPGFKNLAGPPDGSQDPTAPAMPTTIGGP